MSFGVTWHWRADPTSVLTRPPSDAFVETLPRCIMSLPSPPAAPNSTAVVARRRVERSARLRTAWMTRLDSVPIHLDEAARNGGVPVAIAVA